MNLAAMILLGILTILILTAPVQYWVKIGLMGIVLYAVLRGWDE